MTLDVFGSFLHCLWVALETYLQSPSIQLPLPEQMSPPWSAQALQGCTLQDMVVAGLQSQKHCFQLKCDCSHARVFQILSLTWAAVSTGFLLQCYSLCCNGQHATWCHCRRLHCSCRTCQPADTCSRYLDQLRL